MPFTVSHIAAVIPFKSPPFVMSALIIGCMSPDFLYYIPFIPATYFTHTFYALFYFCLPTSLVIYYSYLGYLRGPIISLLPKQLQPGITQNRKEQSLIRICISILIGASTHVIWDSFTHITGYSVKTFYLLREDIIILGQPLFVFKLLQYSSTVLGGIIVCVWLGLSMYNKIDSRSKLKHALAKIRMPMLIGLLCTIAGVIVSFVLYSYLGIYLVIVKSITLSITFATLALVLFAFIWNRNNRSD